jgi:hypothetical protein
MQPCDLALAVLDRIVAGEGFGHVDDQPCARAAY